MKVAHTAIDFVEYLYTGLNTPLYCKYSVRKIRVWTKYEVQNRRLTHGDLILIWKRCTKSKNDHKRIKQYYVLPYNITQLLKTWHLSEHISICLTFRHLWIIIFHRRPQKSEGDEDSSRGLCIATQVFTRNNADNIKHKAETNVEIYNWSMIVDAMLFNVSFQSKIPWKRSSSEKDRVFALVWFSNGWYWTRCIIEW